MTMSFDRIDRTLKIAKIILSILSSCLTFLSLHLSAEVTFKDVTADTGITFRHTDGGSGRRYVVETVSAG